jgi:hypothetical protein
MSMEAMASIYLLMPRTCEARSAAHTGRAGAARRGHVWQSGARGRAPAGGGGGGECQVGVLELVREGQARVAMRRSAGASEASRERARNVGFEEGRWRWR